MKITAYQKLLFLSLISTNNLRVCVGFQPITVIKTTKTQLWSYDRSDSSFEAALTFSTALHYSTPPIEIKNKNHTYQSIRNFFEKDSNALFLLLGSGNMEPRILNETLVRTFRPEWKKEAAYFKVDKVIDPPAREKRCLLELRTRTQFLVFTICAMAILGKYFNQKSSSANSSLPEIQLVLLDEDFEATDGPAPLIWIFNQLTGKGERHPPIIPEKSPSRRHNVHSFLKVYPVVQSFSKDQQAGSENGTDEIKTLVTFHAMCKAEIKIAFPSLLIHILPVPKEVIERQGKNALRKSMERDLIPGMNSFADEFRKTLETNA